MGTMRLTSVAVWSCLNQFISEQTQPEKPPTHLCPAAGAAHPQQRRGLGAEAWK